MERNSQIFVSAERIDDVLTYESLFGAVERALGLYSGRKGTGDSPAPTVVDQPTRSVVMVPASDGFLGCMPVYMEADGLLVTKLVTFFPKNVNVPTHNTIVVVFSAQTGVPRAFLDGDTITTRRTATASAVATKYLVNGHPKVLAILGSGVQAASHYQALARLFKFHQVRVWSRRLDRAEALVSPERHCSNSVACASVEEAVKDADVIVTVTSSKEPILMAQWVKAGAHVNAVGACRPDWAELDPELMRSSVVYVDSREGAVKESGDIIMSKAEIFAEIGEVVNGSKAALKEKTTVFKSLGMAVEDAAAAKVVLDKLGM